MEEKLKKIIEFVDSAHGEQMRKYSPERYIVHPVRVMKTCQKYSPDITVHAAALLHDVLEDTPVSKEEIREFLLSLMSSEQADQTIKMVVELTDEYVKSNYPKLNRRARKARELERLRNISPDAQTIKYADILDNSREILEKDPDFGRVFIHECRTILQELDKGNQDLLQEARSRISSYIDQLNRKPTQK